MMEKLTGLDAKVGKIATNLAFVEDIKTALECVICRFPVKGPVVANCCHRIIGCGKCVRRWLRTNTRCLLCSMTGHMDSTVILKGFDELAAFFRIGESHAVPSPPPHSPISFSDDSGDDDFIVQPPAS